MGLKVILKTNGEGAIQVDRKASLRLSLDVLFLRGAGSRIGFWKVFVPDEE